MKKCPVCGRSNTDDSKFCESCGNQLGDGRNIFDAYKALKKDAVDILLDGRGKYSESGSKEVGSATQGPGSSAQGTGSAVKGTSDNFVAPDETVQATIGVSYIQNFMSGAGFKNGAAILTDKRLYYFGRSFSNVGREINTATEEGVVSVEDISFTRFVHGSPVSLLITAIVSFVLAIIFFMSGLSSTNYGSEGIVSMFILVFLVIGVMFLAAYFAGKSTVLEIAFPGGKYCFNARWHSVANMREFQRQIHVVKDSLKAGQTNGKNEKGEAAQ